MECLPMSMLIFNKIGDNLFWNVHYCAVNGSSANLTLPMYPSRVNSDVYAKKPHLDALDMARWANIAISGVFTLRTSFVHSTTMIYWQFRYHGIWNNYPMSTLLKYVSRCLWEEWLHVELCDRTMSYICELSTTDYCSQFLSLCAWVLDGTQTFRKVDLIALVPYYFWNETGIQITADVLNCKVELKKNGTWLCWIRDGVGCRYN